MKVISLRRLLREFLINEYSEKVIKTLQAKFNDQDPEEVKQAITNFDNIKSKLDVSKRDILKYSWKDLLDTIEQNKSTRIKAGKINTGVADGNLVYNQNNLRVYKAPDQKACVKYGTGYSFCISARGERNAHDNYKVQESSVSSIYFVFDDSKSSAKDEKGGWIDPNHLLVVMRYTSAQSYTKKGTAPKTSTPTFWRVTNAANTGDKTFKSWEGVIQSFPWLEPLKSVLTPQEVDPTILLSPIIKDEIIHPAIKTLRELMLKDGYYGFPIIEEVLEKLEELYYGRTYTVADLRNKILVPLDKWARDVVRSGGHDDDYFIVPFSVEKGMKVKGPYFNLHQDFYLGPEGRDYKIALGMSIKNVKTPDEAIAKFESLTGLDYWDYDLIDEPYNPSENPEGVVLFAESILELVEPLTKRLREIVKK